MEEITVLVTLRHVPKRGYPDEPARVATLAYWNRMFRQEPRYKDPMFEVVAVGTIDQLKDRLAAAEAFLEFDGKSLVQMSDDSWEVQVMPPAPKKKKAPAEAPSPALPEPSAEDSTGETS